MSIMHNEIDVNNFKDYSLEEYKENLERLNIMKHSDLVGSECFYSKQVYGKHLVISWDYNRSEYLLETDSLCGITKNRFYSNPFRILLINN